MLAFKKTFFFPTLNANIFQSVRSNLMKFLPHNLRQVKYKILWLNSKKYTLKEIPSLEKAINLIIFIVFGGLGGDFSPIAAHGDELPMQRS